MKTLPIHALTAVAQEIVLLEAALIRARRMFDEAYGLAILEQFKDLRWCHAAIHAAERCDEIRHALARLGVASGRF